MPIYTFVCSRKHRFDDLVRTPEEEPKFCPTCGRKVKRVTGAYSVAWNGSTIRMADERLPVLTHWTRTEGERRKRLPDGHPDQLREIGKHEDVAHGIVGPRAARAPTQIEQQQAEVSRRRRYDALPVAEKDKLVAQASELGLGAAVAKRTGRGKKK